MRNNSLPAVHAGRRAVIAPDGSVAFVSSLQQYDGPLTRRIPKPWSRFDQPVPVRVRESTPAATQRRISLLSFGR